jgi:hypothetical protein
MQLIDFFWQHTKVCEIEVVAFSVCLSLATKSKAAFASLSLPLTNKSDNNNVVRGKK